MTRVDVLISGGGVAGSFAAIGLARQGLRVMLVDRSELPRHKVCGCCLNRDAVGMLDEAGLGPGLRRAGAHPIGRVVVSSGGRSLQLPSQGGVSLSRYALDALLACAAQDAGCVVHGSTYARITRPPQADNQPVTVTCQHRGQPLSHPVQASVVLVADGLSGTTLSNLDSSKRAIDRHSLRGYGAQLPGDQHGLPIGEVVMRCGPGGYVGSVVLEDGSLDIAAAMQPGWVKGRGGSAPAVASIADHAGHALPPIDHLPWRATAPLTGARSRLWYRGVIVMGDAAGYVEPFTGEGMSWAMRSAQAAVPIVLRAAKGWDPALGAAWTRAYRAAVGKRQWRCRLFSAWLRRPTLTSATIALAATLPQPVLKNASGLILPPMFRSAPPATHPMKACTQR